MTRAYVLDVVERLVKTFGQAFIASLIVTWGGSGLNVSDLGNWSVASKIVIPALLAGLAAVGSVITSLASGWKTGTASLSSTVATTGVATAAPHTAEHAAVPADPDQPAAGVPPATVTS